MKKLFPLLCLVASFGYAHAQGTLEFTAHLSSTMSQAIGDGSFSLTGNLFNYDVQTAYGPQVAEIQGPGSATNAPVIFTLHLHLCEPPLGQYRGGCVFTGNYTLSDVQIAELVSDQWYVNALADSTVLLRGQIIQVPEPSGLALIALGIGFGCLCFWLLPARKCSK